LEDHQHEQGPINQRRRHRRELHQQAATHGATGHAQQRRYAVDQRTLLAVSVEQRGAQYGGGHAGGKALYRASGNQPADAVGIDKQ